MVVKVAFGVFIGLLAFVLVTGWFQSTLIPFVECRRLEGVWTQTEPGRWGCAGVAPWRLRQ